MAARTVSQTLARIRGYPLGLMDIIAVYGHYAVVARIAEIYAREYHYAVRAIEGELNQLGLQQHERNMGRTPATAFHLDMFGRSCYEHSDGGYEQQCCQFQLIH